ncbi:MAG: aminotransferase class I/II-fold pyridoxal phosphate-dependent enzyme [Candidatus Ancillula sp.]|jgi:histidinol-phosphate aminotransferase|nr:aminotransferase class I/II-fold pyridoxal phosphate-dependent enzyme [Candidatus Ancillula sp.]
MSMAFRTDLAGITPYQSFDARVKARLNTNENPYCVPDSVAKEVAKAVQESVIGANRYPSDEFHELREAFAKYIFQTDVVKFTSEQILAANGSNELMDEVFDAFAGPSLGEDGLPNGINDRVALTFSPTYSMYPQYARDSFTKLIQVPRSGEDFSIDIEDAKRAIAKYRPSLVVIANPNNPTGTLTPQGEIRELLKFTQDVSASGSGVGARPVVCVDEAYIDFKNSGEVASAALVHEFSNLLVVRTLSKAFSFAGVRVGYAMSSKSVIDALKVVRLPYNLSSVTQAIACVALKHSSDMLRAVDEIRNAREDMYAWLKTLHYETPEFTRQKLHVVKSSANFIQLGLRLRATQLEATELDTRQPSDPHLEMSRKGSEYGGVQNNALMPETIHAECESFPKRVHDFLIDRGVQIRVVGPKGYFRVTIGTPQENELFRQGFEAFLEEVRSPKAVAKGGEQ